MAKLIFSLIALVAAFTFTFLLPGFGFEQVVLVILASVAGQFGITSWRSQFDLLEGWMRSRTIVGALVVVVPVVACAIIPFVWPAAPAWIVTIGVLLATTGGGTMLLGIFGIKKLEAEKAGANTPTP